MSYITFLGFGALGGLARAMVGIMKQVRQNGRKTELSFGKILINIIGATVVGAVVGLIIDQNPTTAAAVGYSGIDIIESVIKISAKQ